MNAPRRLSEIRRRQRLISFAALSGLAGIVLIAVGVLLFGGRSPSPPALAKKPRSDIPGMILFRDESQCVARAPAAGGTPDKIYCKDTTPSPIAWLDPATAGVSKVIDNTPVMLRIDIATGEELGQEPIPNILDGRVNTEPVSSKGERARVDAKGRLYIGANGAEKEVANFDTSNSRLQPVLWSPDGEWLLLYYTAPRDFTRNEFWIVRRDGKEAGLFYRGTAVPYASWLIDGIGITPN